jgi:MFS family permease
MTAGADRTRVGYGAALANAEFRGITLAQVVSESGDQVARIALAVLVFRNAHSIALTALTYAVGYLPLVIGGALLSPIADRWPRRRAMLACHAARAVLVALIAINGLPLGVQFLLLAGVTLFEAPFTAARSALIPDLLPDGPTYVAAVSLGRALNQVDQAVGFFLGGLVVAVASPRAALLIDSAAFIVAFIVVLVTVQRRPAPEPEHSGSFLHDVRTGAQVVFGDQVRRSLAMLVWLGGLTLILPEGIAVIYAHDLGGGGLAAGALTAAGPFGLFLGIIALTRWVSTRRQADILIGLQACGALLLTITAARPPIVVTFFLWAAPSSTSPCPTRAGAALWALLRRGWRSRKASRSPSAG